MHFKGQDGNTQIGLSGSGKGQVAECCVCGPETLGIYKMWGVS